MNDTHKHDWFAAALATPGIPGHASGTGGTRLHYLEWGSGDTDKPGLLLVHGHRAHAHYWDMIAPAFADRYRVVAMDLSGMGDSARRSTYHARDFADDIAAVIEHCALAPAIVVGHSYGGSRAVRAAAEYPDLIAHVIALDSTFRFPDSPPRQAVPGRRRVEPYPDMETALARYRLVPDQPCDHPRLLEHVARHSLKPEGSGWLWKFDPALPPGLHEDDPQVHLQRVSASVDYVRGQLSTVSTPEAAQRVVRLLRHGRGPVELPGSWHYPMLDQPLALIGVLNALLA